MKKSYSITYKKINDDRIYKSSVFASSVAEAKEIAKSQWGDVRIVSCVENK